MHQAQPLWFGLRTLYQSVIVPDKSNYSGYFRPHTYGSTHFPSAHNCIQSVWDEIEIELVRDCQRPRSFFYSEHIAKLDLCRQPILYRLCEKDCLQIFTMMPGF